MKNFFEFSLLLALLFAPILLQAQDARQIAERSSQAVDFDDMEMAATLTIFDNKGNSRVRQIANASKKFGGVGKTLMKFLAPADVKGTAMLIHDYDDKDDDMWIYLPSLRKTRRIVSGEKGKSFMGSEFSNADMARPNLDQFTHKLLGSERYNGADCWKVESVCLDPGQYGFSRKIDWVEKTTYLTQKIEFYDAGGKRFKEMFLKDYRKQPNGKYFCFLLEMKNLQSGRHSVISIDKFQMGSKFAENYFSADNLERL
jgi:hypothetical protein